MNLHEQVDRIHEVMGLKDMFKNMFGKKEVTKDERYANVIADFIRKNHPIDFSSNDFGEVTFYLTDDTGVWNTPIMKYFPKYKRLEYKWSFAEEIHTWIGDDRLLQPDSETMGKIFEKMFKKKVSYVYGYSRL